MQGFYKTVSILFHPVLLPIASLFSFYIIDDGFLAKEFKLKTLLIVFSSTYIIPVIILAILKHKKLIKTIELKTIQERKLPIVVMTIVFLILGIIFKELFLLYTPANLFLGVSLALLLNLLFFIQKIKVSIHMLGLASLLIFIIKLSILYQENLLQAIVLLILITGVVGSARLHLKAHSASEIYIGFALGVFTQLINVMLYKI